MESIEVKIPPLDRRTEEAFKTLRTNLQFCGKDVKSIALTSCTPNEGKSSVSLQLARSLSENGKRVLFIDADLRKSVILSRCQVPRLHQASQQRRDALHPDGVLCLYG